MHGEKNYPFHKEKSDLDIELKDGTDDVTYLGILDRTLKKIIDEVEPDFIFFQSGVDVIATDKLGKLGLTIIGCKERDKMVLKMAKQNNIPLCASMGGGYSTRISDIIEAHANTFRLAQEIYF
jgi:acetoin utilization deacetylase AcuC-like enzyme